MSTAHASLDDDPELAAKRDTEEYRAARQLARIEIALGRAVHQRAVPHSPPDHGTGAGDERG